MVFRPCRFARFFDSFFLGTLLSDTPQPVLFRIFPPHFASRPPQSFFAFICTFFFRPSACCLPTLVSVFPPGCALWFPCLLSTDVLTLTSETSVSPTTWSSVYFLPWAPRLLRLLLSRHLRGLGDYPPASVENHFPRPYVYTGGSISPLAACAFPIPPFSRPINRGLLSCGLFCAPLFRVAFFWPPIHSFNRADSFFFARSCSLIRLVRGSLTFSPPEYLRVLRCPRRYC